MTLPVDPLVGKFFRLRSGVRGEVLHRFGPGQVGVLLLEAGSRQRTDRTGLVQVEKLDVACVMRDESILAGEVFEAEDELEGAARAEDAAGRAAAE